MMTEKQRRASLDDETNFFYTRRFPYRDGDPIKITEFEFHDLNIYRLDIYTTYYHYSSRLTGWKFRFYFIDGKDGTVEIINKSEALLMMKEAEMKKEEEA